MTKEGKQTIKQISDELRLNIFKNELELINDPIILEFTKILISELPDYFFEIPASSSGKYHPEYTIQKGGLVKHTKAATGIAMELFRMVEYKNLLPLKPYIISALIMHDGFKSGIENSGYTELKHPLISAEIIKGIGIEQNKSNIAHIIAQLVSSHMGQWQETKDPKVRLPYPTSPAQKFVHLCDYLASRKFLEVNFDKMKYEA